MRGFSFVGLVLLCLIAYPLIRDGFVAVKYYYEFYELRAQLAQLARVAASLSRQETEMRVREILRDFETVGYEEVQIDWSEKQVKFSASWSVMWHLDFYGYTLFEKKLNFRIEETTPSV